MLLFYLSLVILICIYVKWFDSVSVGLLHQTRSLTEDLFLFTEDDWQLAARSRDDVILQLEWAGEWAELCSPPGSLGFRCDSVLSSPASWTGTSVRLNFEESAPVSLRSRI